MTICQIPTEQQVVEWMDTLSNRVRWGGDDRLSNERISHIIVRRPYMAELWDEVAETLREPEEIRRSRSDPDTVRLYYKWYYGTVVGDKWVCVVVKALPHDAFIMTAYVTSEVEGGNTL